MSKNLFFTLPDDISIGRCKNKYKLSSKIYLYLFYLFRFFIFKESLFLFTTITNMIFDNNYSKKIIIKNNIKEFMQYYYKAYLLYLDLKDNVVIGKIIISWIGPVINLSNYLRISIMNKKVYNNKFIYKLSKPEIILFKEFSLRIPFIIYIGFKSYIYKFRIYKYNEYLYKISNLIKYPLLKIILRKDFKVNKIYLKDNIQLSFKIYFDKFKKYKNLNFIKFKFLYFLKKSKFYKFFKLFKKKNFFFLYSFLKIYFINIFYIYLYNIWMLQLYANYDWLETSKWNIFYIFHLYWWLYKYNFDLPVWLYILVIIQVIKIYFNNSINKLNMFNLSQIKKKKYILKELIFRKINSIILITHFEKIYFKFFKQIKYKSRTISRSKWKKSWNLIIKNYPLDFLYLPLNYYNNNHFLNYFYQNYIYNFDKIHWKIFYTGDIYKFATGLNLNDNILFNHFNSWYKSICIFLMTYNRKKENLLINFLFFYYMLRDLFFKIILKTCYRDYLNKVIWMIKHYYRKKLNIEFKNLNKTDYLIKLKKSQLGFFLILYDKYICLIILIIFIKKYTK